MSVKGEAGFQAKRITGPQAYREDSLAGALVEDLLPDPHGSFGREEKLKAQGFPGVSRPGHIHRNPLDRDAPQVVLPRVRQPGPSSPQEAFQKRFRQGALQGDHGDLFGQVFHGHPGKLFPEFLQPVPVLLRIGGIDHQEVFRLFETVEVGVVDRSAGFIGQDSVLSLPRLHGKGIIGQGILQEGQGALPGDPEPSHVGDVKEAAGPARGEVLLHNSRFVVQGHLPTPEINHVGPMTLVPGIQSGFFRFRGHFRLPRLKLFCFQSKLTPIKGDVKKGMEAVWFN